MDKHYDVAIVGVWFGANYGSLINGYAIYKILRSMGLSVLMVNKPNVTPDDWEITNSHCTRFIHHFYSDNEISPLLSYEQLPKLNEYCDTFLAGSDQIWHYNLTKGFHYTMMLNFVDDNKKKISFGTSFGHQQDFTPPEILPKTRSLIRRFDAISMREQSGVDICHTVYGVRAKATIEPVFCLTADQYKEIASFSDLNETDPYIFAYILDPTPEKIQAIQYYSNLTGWKIISILDGNPFHYKESRKLYNLPNTLDDPGAEDLIKLCQDASFVITDSFHGSCFSIILNKPFLSITNLKRGKVRFYELMEKFGLQDHLATDPIHIQCDEKLLQPIDYTTINQLISTERLQAIEWLKTVIEMPRTKLPNIVLEDAVDTIVQKKECTGCGTCALLCPTNAIEMKPNHEGFLNPVIDKQKCIRCGLCTKQCPSQNPVYKNNSDPKCYAVMANDEIRKVSSSGGMFSIVAECILDQGGYVCGAAFNNNFSVEHIIIHDKTRLFRLRGSKYIQSNTGVVFQDIKKLLDENNTVLFTGMPCQVAGLYSYLRKDYEKLYTIDLLCHGITSSKVFSKYRKDIFGDKILKRLEFKEKEPWGWHAGVNAYFVDDSKYSQPAEKDPYYIAYLNNISKNTTCATCKMNRLPRQGDMTIGDFWGIDKYDPTLNDGKGTSVVLLNNSKATVLFELLKENMTIAKEVPLQIAKNGNGCIEHPYPLHKNRNLFFQYLNELSFDKLTFGCRDNNVYEQFRLEQRKKIPDEDYEFYLIAKIVQENYNGRKIVTWIRSAKFERILKQYFNLTVSFGISMRKEALVKDKILDYKILAGNSKEYYLVALDRAYDDKTYKELNSFGYYEIKDVIFRMIKPIVLENYDLSKGNYYDPYGNTIEGYNSIIGKIVFRGFNNHIVLGKNINTAQRLSVDFRANGFVQIDDSTRFLDTSKMEFYIYNGSATVKIGKACVIRDALWRLYADENHTLIKVNENCTFGENIRLHANVGKKIVIGRDCMFSRNIVLMAGDGHTIFDVKTSKNINSDYKSLPTQKNQLIIGEHVWVGEYAFILHGTNIGNGSIIGARSVVKSLFPNNCSIGGNPAKQISADIAWSRDMYANGIDKCGLPEYVSATKASNAAITGLNVLVIGGTKFMGICLVEELIARGNCVTIATRGITPDTFGLSVNRIHLDVTDEKSVSKSLTGKTFDVIFDNLAYSPTNVNNILSNVTCKRYVQLSSVAVYTTKMVDIHENQFELQKLYLEDKTNDVSYGTRKRQSEKILSTSFKTLSAVTVRIPYVTKTDRLYYYVKNIIKQIPMRIGDTSCGMTFVRDTEVGKFLPWIAAQDYNGSINLSSEGIITIQMILDYVQHKTGKKAIIDNVNGLPSPFNEKTFSLNVDKIKQLGYHTSNLNDWFWKLIDEYISQALKEK